MNEIKKIKIFLASSVSEKDEPELVRDRDKIGAFCNQLNAHFVDRGLFFYLIDCTEYDRAMNDKGKQEQLDRDIQESALVFFLFFTKVGQYTRHEFDIALDAYREKKSPRILTFFRYRNSPDEATGDVNAFKQELANVHHHYYNVYNSIDTLKLGMLMQILMLQLDDGAFLPSVENGIVQFANIAVGSTDNIAMFSNSYLTRLRDDLKNTTQEYLDVQEAYFKLKESGEEDDLLYNDYCNLASKKADLEAQLRSAEKVVLATIEDMYRKTANGINGEIVTERLARAYHAFEEGKTALAREILNLEEILHDAQHSAEIADMANQRLQAHVNEMLFRIKLLQSDPVTEQSAQEILRIYEIAYGFITKYPLDKFPLYDYASFLHEQNNHTEAIKVAEVLRHWIKYLQNANTNESYSSLEIEHQSAKLYNLLGILYRTSGQFAKAETLLTETLNICYKLALRDPDIFNIDVATALNNLGILYSQINQYDKAKKFFEKALEIYNELVKKYPDTFNADFAGLLNNLSVFYCDIDCYDQAEKYYDKALTIYRDLAQINPNTYDPFVATILINLSMLYSDLEEFDKAETTACEALNTYRRLAKRNPAAFAPSVASTLNNLCILYDNLKRSTEAEKIGNEAVAIYREIAQTNPDVFNIELARTLNNLGIVYRNLGRNDDAERVLNETLAIRRELAQKNPDAYMPEVAAALNNLGNLYRDIEHYENAEKAYDETLAIRRELAQTNPDIYEPLLAKTLFNMVRFYSRLGRHDEGKLALLEAYELAKKYRDTNPFCRQICQDLER